LCDMCVVCTLSVRGLFVVCVSCVCLWCVCIVFVWCPVCLCVGLGGVFECV